MIPYCTFEDVIQLTGVTEDKMGIDEEDNYTLKEVIEKWIIFASALIDEYTQNPLTTEQLATGIRAIKIKQNVYCDVCARIVANRVALREAYKNYAVIRKDDWSLGSVKSDIFTDSEKADLDQYRNDELTGQTIIGISTIKGRNQKWS